MAQQAIEQSRLRVDESPWIQATVSGPGTSVQTDTTKHIVIPPMYQSPQVTVGGSRVDP
jgi:hypothetical protein